MGTLRIGCSGWYYPEWVGHFYPPDTPRKELLRAYACRFSTTEINSSFYRVPTEGTVRRWHDETPDGFLFAWKASRFITHRKRLRDVGDSIAKLMGRMEGLREKCGPVLWQLPPLLRRDDDRFAAFLWLLPKRHLHAVEFRDRSWYVEPVFDLLRSRNVALCMSDHRDAPAPHTPTARHVYVRLHGPGGGYSGSYRKPALAGWADEIVQWRRAGRSVFVYFDNDPGAAAPRNARTLIDLVSERGAKVG